MDLFTAVLKRAQSKCELCSGTEGLSLFELPPVRVVNEETSVVLCKICDDQLKNPLTLDQNHWRCLNESMWSEFLPVQVMAFRILSLLRDEGWARDLLDQLYLDEAALAFAMEGLPVEEEADTSAPTLDGHGVPLLDGDSITLIKDLEVKGAGFTAKRGTLVKNISLTSNPKHIEGRVNGIQIVLVAAFLKKV